MILLQPTDFTGIYRIDNQPALAQDINAATDQIENRIGRLLFGRWWNFIVANPASLLAQAILDGNNIYLSHGWREYVLPIVHSNIYSLVGFRGAINEKEIWERIFDISGRGLLYKIYYELFRMKQKLETMTFQTDINGDFTIDITDITYMYDGEHYILPPDVGFEYLDLGTNTTVTVSAITFAANVYTISVGVPNTDLRLLTTLPKYSDIFVPF